MPRWQCASRILCHHANAARRSPQLSSTLGVSNRHYPLAHRMKNLDVWIFLAAAAGALACIVAIAVELRRNTPQRWRKLGSLALLPIAMAALVAWDSWPEEWSRTRCLEDASHRPTPNGVALAIQLCVQLFPKR